MDSNPSTEPATAAMAVISRCANHALCQQIEHAYAAIAGARDSATAAAEVTARDCPPGPARDAVLAALARHRVDSERLMRAVLRFGREHGHLAFAFRYAADSPRTRRTRAPRPKRKAGSDSTLPLQARGVAAEHSKSRV